MGSLAWKGKYAYFVYYVKKKQVWKPLGKFHSKAAAKEEFMRHELYFDEAKAKKITVKDLSPFYLDHLKTQNAPSTFERKEYHMDILKEEFGETFMHDLSPQMIEGWIQKKTWKATTWRNRLNLLKGLIQYAKDRDYRTQDTFKGIKIPCPKIWEFERRAVPLKDLDLVISNLNGEFKAIALVLRYTACRPSEVFRLEKEDIDNPKGYLRIYTKKPSRIDHIPINDAMREALESVPFTLKQDSFAGALQRACLAAHLPKNYVTPYIFRHSVATALLEQGADLRDVQALLRHTTPLLTARYTIPNKERLNKLSGMLTVETPQP